ncbi:Lipid A biosynthesis lauroyl acyltransferase [hydrothermal vent metagenome]|uniref:Lipid A biosynthesis lauroyl acyltransferase n=1 Tax=hydrothermal vent metagenome TaxID=652676 RepID=A0A3B0WRK9_9ZZZZ
MLFKSVNPLEYLAPKYWPTWIALAIMRLVILLPLPGIVFCGSALGQLIYVLLPSRRKVAEINLRFAFPNASDKEITRLCNRSFKNMSVGAFELALNWWQSEKLLALCKIEGAEHLSTPQGKGIILLTAHFTCLEMCGPTLVHNLSMPFQVMYKPAHNKLFNAFMFYHRNRLYEAVVNYHKPIAMIRGLKKGNAAWYAPDQDFRGKDMVFVPFFGVQASTLTAPARFAKMTGSPIVPYYVKRNDDNRSYRLVILPPLKNFPTDNTDDDALLVNQTLEHLILQNPEQYLWVHKRYKNRPEGEPAIYSSKKKK